MNNKLKLGLILSFALTVLTRVMTWHSKGGLFRRNGSANIDDYLNSARLVAEGNIGALMSYRPTQLLYPILLSPITRFGLSEDIYIFWLHMGLTLSTTFLIFMLGKKLLNPLFGVIAALAFSVFPLPFVWFTWAMTETLYYSLAILHVLVFFYALEKRTFLIGLLFTTILLAVTKLDVLPMIALSWAFIWLKYAGEAFGKPAARLSLLFFVVISTSSLVLSIASSPKLQSKLRQHFHVSVGLWVSTHTASNANANEHNEAIALQGQINPKECYTAEGAALYGSVERCVRDFYSRIGIQFIRDNPARWMKMNWIRFTSHLMPAMYHTNWTPLYRFVHFSISFFVIFGASFSLVLAPNGNIRFFYFLALSTLAIPAIYEADAELRFRIISQIMWLVIAPYGWLLALARIKLLSWLQPTLTPCTISSKTN